MKVHHLGNLRKTKFSCELKSVPVIVLAFFNCFPLDFVGRQLGVSGGSMFCRHPWLTEEETQGHGCFAINFCLNVMYYNTFFNIHAFLTAYLSLKVNCWNFYDVCQEIFKEEVMSGNALAGESATVCTLLYTLYSILSGEQWSAVTANTLTGSINL